MASGDEDGGPAFPVPGIAGSILGMTMRDWFAGQALAGIQASLKGEDPWDPKADAGLAYDLADAMLAQRKAPLP